MLISEFLEVDNIFSLVQFSKSESQMDIKVATRVHVPSSLEIGCMLVDGNSVWVAGSGMCLFDAQVPLFIAISTLPSIFSFQSFLNGLFQETHSFVNLKTE